jgi:hypothetical protein
MPGVVLVFDANPHLHHIKEDAADPDLVATARWAAVPELRHAARDLRLTWPEGELPNTFRHYL